MRKVVQDGYILAVSLEGEGITEKEYKEILNALENKPKAPNGYGYKLKENLEWEMFKKYEEAYL